MIDINEERKKILDGIYPSRIISGRQNKHIEGTKEFEQNKEKMIKIGSAPAILHADAQSLVEMYKGTGNIYFAKSSPEYPREDIDTKHIIGKTWDRKKSEYIDATIITIAYSKTGTHVFPNNYIRR